MNVYWTLQASEDLLAIFDYIAEDRNETVAVVIIEHLLQAGERLASFPQLGKPGRVTGSRELTIPPYVLTYQAIADTIRIDSVLHSARNFGYRLPS